LGYHRDDSVHAELLGAVHGAHAALPDALEQLEPAMIRRRLLDLRVPAAFQVFLSHRSTSGPTSDQDLSYLLDALGAFERVLADASEHDLVSAGGMDSLNVRSDGASMLLDPMKREASPAPG